MIVDSEKVTARRLMWYGMLGGQNTQAFGYRWATEYGLMEFRMNNMLPQEEEQFRTMLSQCLSLEQKLLDVACSLDTDSAGPWKRNKSQLKETNQLYKLWRMKLCNFIGLKPGPEFSGRQVLV